MNVDTDSDHRGTARAVAAAAAGLGGLIAVRSALPAGTPRIRLGGKADSARSIAALEKVRIGGCDQWVLERSENVDNPVVLYLHGGPGTSQLTSNRRNTRHLEKFFTVVNWDQRGAGKSYQAISDTDKMNIGQFVQDTRELTLYLLEKFRQERLVLVGHSWGKRHRRADCLGLSGTLFVLCRNRPGSQHGRRGSGVLPVDSRPGQGAPESEGNESPPEDGAAALPR